MDMRLAQPDTPWASGKIRADRPARCAGPVRSSPYGALPGSAHFSSSALFPLRGFTHRPPGCRSAIPAGPNAYLRTYGLRTYGPLRIARGVAAAPSRLKPAFRRPDDRGDRRPHRRTCFLSRCFGASLPRARAPAGVVGTLQSMTALHPGTARPASPNRHPKFVHDHARDRRLFQNCAAKPVGRSAPPQSGQPWRQHRVVSFINARRPSRSRRDAVAAPRSRDPSCDSDRPPVWRCTPHSTPFKRS